MAFVATLPSVTKGRLTDANTGDFREFSLNPTEIEWEGTFSYPDFELPGQSHPVAQAGAGGPKQIRFTLRLDADVGYRTRRTSTGVVGSNPDALRGGAETSPSQIAVDITDEINWYVSHLYPEGNARLGEPNASPAVLLFSYGPLFAGVRCVMPSCTYRVTKMSPLLVPMRADVTITLKEVPSASVSRSSVYDRGNPRRNY